MYYLGWDEFWQLSLQGGDGAGLLVVVAPVRLQLERGAWTGVKQPGGEALLGEGGGQR